MLQNNAERNIEAFTCYAGHCNTDEFLMLFCNTSYSRM